MAKYRAGVIGLGWMGMLADIAKDFNRGVYAVDDIDRPTPALDVHRKFPYHEGLGPEGIPHTWAEALYDRPDVQLVAGAERDPKRLAAFAKRYGARTYADAEQMLREEKLDIVAIATNVKGRADLTCLAVEYGAGGIAVEKPMAHTLEEADRMVRACAEAGIPLCAGAIPANHPSYAGAKKLVTGGAIGDVLSMETGAPAAQKQSWSYFVDSAPAWVAGTGGDELSPSGSDEFHGHGIMMAGDGLAVHFRVGGPGVRVTGSTGEIVLGAGGWRLWRDFETPGGPSRVETPWPGPQLQGGFNAICGLSDVIDSMEGRLDEPKNSGRRVAVALEVEIALKLSSARGGARVDLPLEDRSLGLSYDWFR